VRTALVCGTPQFKGGESRPETIAAMRKALEKAGLEFTNRKRPRVRMNLQPKLQPQQS